MAILLKTASVRVSSIQIMQVRVQNKGKSVWKSRYVGDVSTPPSLNLCLSSSNSVDKLKVIKKNFYKLCLLLFTFGEKKIREKDSSRFTIRSRRQALKPLGRADLESVRGSGEGNPSPSSSSTILHHQFHDAHRRA